MVGSSTFLNLNLSFNEIRQLSTNYMDNESEVPSLNIKVSLKSGKIFTEPMRGRRARVSKIFC